MRLGTFGTMWRYDEPQYGRYRWLYQWDVELWPLKLASRRGDHPGCSLRPFHETRAQAEDTSWLSKDRRILHQAGERLDPARKAIRVLDSLRAIDKLSKKSLEQIAEVSKDSVSKDELANLADFVNLFGEKDAVSSALSNYRLDSKPLLDIVDALKARGVFEVEPEPGRCARNRLLY